MSHFTNEQSLACQVQRCESVTVGGTHQYYVLAVTDDNGEYYEWTNDTLSSTATPAEIKTAICDHLCENVEKRTPAPVIEHATMSDIVGGTVDAIGATA